MLKWLAPAMFIGALGLAVQAADESTHDGKLVSITADKLTMTNAEGKEHSHTLAGELQVTCDGKSCQPADLKPGARIRVTTQGADGKVATRIEALDKNTAFASNHHDGKFVTIADETLTMSDKEGKEHSHTLAQNATFTLDGKTCKAVDLKPGTRIRVTTKAGDASVAVGVEAIDKQAEFARPTHDGVVVSITGKKVVMTAGDSKAEHTCTLTADAKITCDGKACKSSDLKPGMRIRVTGQEDDPHAATHVEAIDKNREFKKVAAAN
jgi:predicted DNA-binding antitoxin AbrB/MazE fold protein